MGQIADDMIEGACCALCGVYFKETNEEGKDYNYEHGYPVACSSCYTPDCGYEEALCEKTF